MYCVPLVRPEIVHDVPVSSVVHVKVLSSESVAVARYPSIVPPPADDALLQVTSIDSSPGVSETRVGYDGTVIGVDNKVDEGSEVPAALVAVTDTVYSVPFVRPVMVQVVPEDPVVQSKVFKLVSIAVAVKPVTAVPLFEPALHVTAID